MNKLIQFLDEHREISVDFTVCDNGINMSVIWRETNWLTSYDYRFSRVEMTRLFGLMPLILYEVQRGYDNLKERVERIKNEGSNSSPR